MLKFKNNSKHIKKGDIFICTHDIYDDRHKYISDAIKNGCKAIIIDKDIKPNNKMFIKVQNTNDTYYQILNNYYNYPLDNLKLVGITVLPIPLNVPVETLYGNPVVSPNL